MVPIGQHMANLRRQGAKNDLGKDPDRAVERAAQLTTIDEDWDLPVAAGLAAPPPRPADLVDADGQLPDIAPGVLLEGDDIGRWLHQ
ncbi:hypothetical protein [Streptomyces sp. NPDC001546]|uniref:hypothetical protein n=1 Tax=Streptomyces sp. NPDC001546 TaxID=3364585 RepID=UPI0036AE4BF7